MAIASCQLDMSSGLSPLSGAPLCLCVRDISRLIPSNNGKLFRLDNLSVSKVEIWAFVTSVQRKEESYCCFLDDCTGEIQCFLSINKTPENINKESSLLKMLSRTMLSRFEEHVPKVGDMIHLQGIVKHGLWNKVVYINSYKWKVVENDHSDQLWVDFGQRQVSLYTEFYNVEMALSANDDVKLHQARKIYHVKTISKQLTEKLYGYASKWFVSGHKHGDCSIEDFYTYELLEFSEVVQISNEIFDVPCLCSGSFSVSEKKHILAFAMSKVLRSLEKSGYLFQTDSDSSCADSYANFSKNKHYKVTLQYSSLIQLVNNILQGFPRMTVKEILLKISAPTSDFSFLRCLGNSLAVVELIHKTLQDEKIG